jgi:hypothetical protein
MNCWRHFMLLEGVPRGPGDFSFWLNKTDVQSCSTI